MNKSIPRHEMKTIILIRHAEKVISDPIHLSQEGRIRAGGLVNYFSSPPLDWGGIPQSIYAMRPSSFDTSHRCIETVRPLAKYLDISVNIDYDKLEIDLLVDRIRQDIHDVILVCWEHHMIPSIANLLGYPTEYWGFTPFLEESHNCFNATWVLQKDGSLKIYPQFDIRGSDIVYTRPKNVPVFTWKKSLFCCVCL